MNDGSDKTDSDKTDSDSQDNAASAPAAGERLAVARRQQQIALSEIAKELHLDEYKVRALERNDFDVIGAPVFAKGHLRKYAQLVNVAADDVMADYYQLERSAGAPPALKLRKRLRQEFSPLPWIVALIAVAAAALAFWWFSSGNTVTPPQATNEVAALPTIVERSEVAVPIARVDANPNDAATADIEVAAGERLADISDEPAAEQLRLRLTYRGDCWTEITDAKGQRLFFDLGSTGRIVELSGEAPFNALFGNAANVSLNVNGAPFEILTTDRRGTARLTITGP